MAESMVESPVELLPGSSHIHSVRMPYHKPEIHTEAVHTEAVHTEADHTETDHTGVVRIETDHTETDHTGVVRIETDHTETDHTGVVRIEIGHTGTANIVGAQIWTLQTSSGPPSASSGSHTSPGGGAVWHKVSPVAPCW